MADDVSIANLALASVGENSQIRSLDEDSHAARTIRAAWDPVRQAVLRDHPWNFAMMRSALASQPGAVTYPWTAFFPLPDGFLRLVEVLDPPASRDCFSVENGGIMANTTGPLWILFVGDVPETGKWDTMFTAAFAQRLAFTIADRITADLNRKQGCWQAYRQLLVDARGVDAKENPPVRPVDDDWIDARFR